MKTERLEIRVDPRHKGLFEQAAAIRGQSLSGFALTTLLEHARRIVEAHETTRLSDRDAARFLEILDSEEVAPALRAAVDSVRERDA